MVPRTEGMNIVGCKWVYKIKLKANCSLERLKARLVAKEFNQMDGVEFFRNLLTHGQTNHNPSGSNLGHSQTLGAQAVGCEKYFSLWLSRYSCLYDIAIRIY